MKIFDGIIVSVIGGNTVSVSVERKVPHPLYGKLMKRNKKYQVDLAGFEVNIGDNVQITETKPISKNKYFKISKVVGKKVVGSKTEKSEDKKTPKKTTEAKVEKVAKTKVARSRRVAK